ncbi:MAG: hypothetical protein KBS81_07030, partial [Spirochaetales bacterium]|nr:hypothetical protein [Candidatus Physcosoma equi]
LLSVSGALFMVHGRRHHMETPQEITAFYFGKRSAPIVEGALEIFLYAIFVIMIAGFGATFSEFYGFSPWVGRILVTILVFLTSILGLRKLIDVLGVLGPVLIAFTVFTGLYGALKGSNTLESVDALLPTLDVFITPGGALVSGVLYPCFNFLTVFYFLSNTGRAAEGEKEAFWGGIIGGIFLGLAILVLNLGFLRNLETVGGVEVPTLALASLFHPSFAFLYSALILIGIYGVSVPSLWSVTRHFGEDGSRRTILSSLALSLLALLLSATDFRTLVNIIYPYSGYVGVVLVVLLFYRGWKDSH